MTITDNVFLTKLGISCGSWDMKPCPCGYDTCSVYYTDNGYFPKGSGYCIEDARLISVAPELFMFIIFELIDQDIPDQRMVYLIEKITQKSWATVYKIFNEVYF